MINPELDFQLSLKPAPLLEGEWLVPADLDFLDGHFPQAPTVPGFVVLEVCLAFARQSTARPTLQLTGVSSAKFTQPLTPGNLIQIRATRTGEDLWDFKWERAGDSVAEVRLRLSRGQALHE